ncbi:MAG: valine--tRNA ligase [Bacillota bacterium]
MSLEKSYNPQGFEKELYEKWEKNGYFTAKVDKDKTPFTIMMPPPNITGQLHLGHALDNTIQDSIIRYKRMKGFSALWLPGTDHASIATEVKIVEAMAKEGVSKEDLGRDGFLERAWEWKEQYGGRIVEQLKTLGSSCDWSRLAFTMDEKCSKAVKKVFVDLYEKGLIYQGNRIINWCPDCKTALSDAEVEYEEQSSFFWHVKYPVKDSDEFVIVATTRPETMLGDTAVAVNPNDERYAHLVGKTLILPLIDKEIPVVADDYVDMEFGTGCVKITPAHDPNDFEVGLRHNLPVVRTFTDDGKLNELGGKYCGMDRFEARKAMVADLEALGLMHKIEPHPHNVGTCYRCKTVIEPIVSKQWFVSMKQLADPALKAVKEEEVNFIPKRFENIYFSWMENIRDWCISRQLWWGHRIPAYTCTKCGEMVVALEKPQTCRCGHCEFTQDEDVLDTWFSSALWPFSTLGYPDDTADLEYFYPTNVLATGYDIIFFWVARMIFSGIENMGKPPFEDVLIHGIIRDAEGRKMSKSLGNGIDPIEVIDQYGADALRFSLLFGVAAGSDSRFKTEKLDSARNFMNKIWNATRFALMNFEGKDVAKVDFDALSLADKWIITKKNILTKEIEQNMAKYELGVITQKLYDFVWTDFCDWYIELIKPVLYGEDEVAIKNTLSVLNYVLKDILKLLHPFVPFVTEKLASELPGATETIMLESYPEYVESEVFEKEAGEMEAIMELIRGLRNVRKDMDVPPSRRVDLDIVAASADAKATLESGNVYIVKLGYGKEVKIADVGEFENAIAVVTSLGTVYMNLSDLVDIEKEKARLQGEINKIKKELNFNTAKLANEGFMAKAPEKLKESILANKVKYEELLKKAEESLAKLG